MKKSLYVYFSGIMMFLLMASCNKNDYRSSVPRESSWVLSVNMSSVEKKIQKENTLIQDFLSRQMFWPACVSGLIFNPGTGGLSDDAPLIFFPEKGMGAIMCLAEVKDDKKLEEYLKGNDCSMTLKQEKNFMWAYDGKSNYCAYTGDRALFFRAPDIKEGMEQAAKLLSLKKDKSILADTVAAPLLRAEDDMTLYAVPSRMFAGRNDRFLSDLFPQGFDIASLYEICRLNIGKDRIHVLSDFSSNNARTRAILKEYAGVLKSASGDLLRYVPENMQSVISVGVNSEKLYELMTHWGGIIEGMDEMFGDARGMITSLTGDVLIASSVNGRGPASSFVLWAKVKSYALPNALMRTASVFGALRNYGDYYGLSYGDDYYFGVKGNNFFITNDRSFASVPVAGYELSAAAAPYASVFRDSPLSMIMNFEDAVNAGFPKDMPVSYIECRKTNAGEEITMFLTPGILN